MPAASVPPLGSNAPAIGLRARRSSRNLAPQAAMGVNTGAFGLPPAIGVYRGAFRAGPPSGSVPAPLIARLAARRWGQSARRPLDCPRSGLPALCRGLPPQFRVNRRADRLPPAFRGPFRTFGLPPTVGSRPQPSAACRRRWVHLPDLGLPPPFGSRPRLCRWPAAHSGRSSPLPLGLRSAVIVNAILRRHRHWQVSLSGSITDPGPVAAVRVNRGPRRLVVAVTDQGRTPMPGGCRPGQSWIPCAIGYPSRVDHRSLGLVAAVGIDAPAPVVGLMAAVGVHRAARIARRTDCGQHQEHAVSPRCPIETAKYHVILLHDTTNEGPPGSLLPYYYCCRR